MDPFAAAPHSPGLKIRWDEGWVEDFPEDEFAEECDDRPRRIWMYRHRTARCLCEYSLSVNGAEALLDYGGRFREANSAPDRELIIGVTRIRFVDENRTVVKNVTWQDEGEKTFAKYGIIASWSHGTAESSRKAFLPPRGDHRLRELLTSVLRPGQLRFRRTLLSEYHGRCCITGIEHADVLEAAHIMPYRGSDFDHPRNGLLLRADLHRLFDRLLLSIDPRTLKIVLSRSLREDSTYGFLEGKPLLLGDGVPKPSSLALGDHWKRFQAGA